MPPTIGIDEAVFTDADHITFWLGGEPDGTDRVLMAWQPDLAEACQIRRAEYWL